MDAWHAPAAPRTDSAVAKRAWHGLVRVLTGPEPPRAWRWRSSQERRVAYAALGVVTLALCVANLVGAFAIRAICCWPCRSWRRCHWRPGYPMLAWRIGWLALLLVPLVPAAWWGGWPWGARADPRHAGGVLPRRNPPAATGTVVDVGADPHPVAAVAYRRHANWHGPAGSIVSFTAVVIAVDNIGSRLRAQRSLAIQTERAEDERARRAVLEERTRIARELHDVVAHHMSLIAVRAETAPYRFTGLSACPGRVQLTERGGTRGAGRDAATARRAAPRPARRSRAAAPAI